MLCATHQRPFAGRHPIAVLIACLVLVAPAASISALTINVTDSNPGGSDPNALAAFATAASAFEQRYSDPITINVDFSFETLGTGILGSAWSDTGSWPYTYVKTALDFDVTTADDAIAVANLPGGAALSFLTTDPSGSPQRVLDNNGSDNNLILDVNRANAKALGLLGASSARDADIQFSDQFAFDFDPSDGITPGTFDFVGVSIHEIGHAMGFVSGVDIVDYWSPVDLNNASVYSVLDLYRYSDASLAEGAGVLDLTFAGSPYFSIDAGATGLTNFFATGQYNGDGRQASHWKDNLSLGLMDPTVSPGEVVVFSPLDEQAFDAIGYDLIVIPTPQTAVGGALVLAALYMGRSVRRRSHSTSRGA